VTTSYSQQVVRSFLWQGGAQAAGQAVSWIVTIVVIRLLSPADYGLMAMANVFLGFFLLFADLGFGAAAVQARTVEREQLRRMLGIVLVTNVGGCLLAFGAAPFVAAFFGEPRLSVVVRVLSVNFLLLAIYLLPQSQLLREMDFRTKARIDVVALIAAAAASLTLAFAGFGVWALVAGSLVTHSVKAVAYNVARPVAVVPAFSWQAITGLARFGALITVDRLLFFVYGQADIAIGGRVLGKEAIGLYAVALSLAAIPMEKVLPVITQVSFAAFARIQSDPDRVRRNLMRAVQLISLFTFPAFLGMAAVAGDLVPVVLGPKWIDLIVPFQLLCLVLPLKALAAAFPPALFGVGRPGVNVVNMAVALVVITAAILVGVQYGVIGMCLAWLIAYPVVFAVISWRSLRALDTRYSEFLERCAFPVMASLTMAAGVIALREALMPLGVSVARLAVLVAAGAMIYGGLVFLFQRVAVRELIAVVRS
jgi:O-antigen/teichoic acid export membrane protein